MRPTAISALCRLDELIQPPRLSVSFAGCPNHLPNSLVAKLTVGVLQSEVVVRSRIAIAALISGKCLIGRK